MLEKFLALKIAMTSALTAHTSEPALDGAVTCGLVVDLDLRLALLLPHRQPRLRLDVHARARDLRGVHHLAVLDDQLVDTAAHDFDLVPGVDWSVQTST